VAGVVFSSMEHLGGRRPPHARERSEAAMRERSDGLRRAELMVWLTERVARDGVTAPQQVRAMAAEALSSFPEAPGAGCVPRAAVGRGALGGAVAGRGAGGGVARRPFPTSDVTVSSSRTTPACRGRASLNRSGTHGDGDRRIRSGSAVGSALVVLSW